MKPRQDIEIITINADGIGLSPEQAWWVGHKFRKAILAFYDDPKNMADFEAWRASKAETHNLNKGEPQ